MDSYWKLSGFLQGRVWNVMESSTSYTYDNVYELSASNSSMFMLCVLQSYKMTDMKTLLDRHCITMMNLYTT